MRSYLDERNLSSRQSNGYLSIPASGNVYIPPRRSPSPSPRVQRATDSSTAISSVTLDFERDQDWDVDLNAQARDLAAAFRQLQPNSPLENVPTPYSHVEFATVGDLTGYSTLPLRRALPSPQRRIRYESLNATVQPVMDGHDRSPASALRSPLSDTTMVGDSYTPRSASSLLYTALITPVSHHDTTPPPASQLTYQVGSTAGVPNNNRNRWSLSTELIANKKADQTRGGSSIDPMRTQIAEPQSESRRVISWTSSSIFTRPTVLTMKDDFADHSRNTSRGYEEVSLQAPDFEENLPGQQESFGSSMQESNAAREGIQSIGSWWIQEESNADPDPTPSKQVSAAEESRPLPPRPFWPRGDTIQTASGKSLRAENFSSIGSIFDEYNVRWPELRRRSPKGNRNSQRRIRGWIILSCIVLVALNLIILDVMTAIGASSIEDIRSRLKAINYQVSDIKNHLDAVSSDEDNESPRPAFSDVVLPKYSRSRL
ncbi:hypothetical protein BJ742DRAFT_902221 [Cladochytrium replicatum]|nr:hypothetical protein BJ742DRAFT_902221 [Cladochytrium replicatum]